MKLKIIIYAVIGIACQIGLGYLTGLGQGSIGLLLFIVMVELDKDFSFRYFLTNATNDVQSNSIDKEEKEI